MTDERAPAAPVAPPPVPADIGIVAALPIEVAPFLARLKHVRKYVGPRHTVHEGECEGRIVALVVSGVGGPSARGGAELLLAGHRPRWLISAGFGGALCPELHRNDTVFASQVATEEEGPPRLSIDLDLVDSGAAGARVKAGSLLTVSRIIRTAAEKARLRERTAADLVDMETYPVAAFCADRGVRFLAIRVISDEAGTDLPPEVLSILGPTGGFRLGAAMGAIWRRPSSVKDLLALREHAHQAAHRLAEVLPQVLGRLS